MHNPTVIAAIDLTETKGLSDMALTCMASGMTAEAVERIASVFLNTAAELRRASFNGEIGHA